MKIKNIKVYKIDIPLKEGSYKWAHNNHVEKFDTSIVVIETDNNIFGLGEVCTLGSSYLPAYSKGVRSGILEIGQALIGKDPTDISNINLEMEKINLVINLGLILKRIIKIVLENYWIRLRRNVDPLL